ncbi:hypothetical protein DX887_23075 [Vibrio alginolyticus]|uniref:hypothetical protein n=1 Tax=Vibrio TaxID=662 RepID=UPI0006CA88C7|nr:MULTISPECIES: hypothetical protein [Vibrio]EGR2558677.1 hypothetical protein [Vibrio alginolyticus]EHC9866231.1 hypothetical protein [Vibrio alginolyticus]EJS0322063.1 hypothetical protein [Vibrio alginolyticus]EJV5742691.1 hypothetical protein [Vibrio alginolyticus]EKD1483733.1 hypothetical protein [Vibrio alginolyticus]
MARIYRLQLDATTLSEIAAGKVVATEILKFDSNSEIQDFTKDPEGFVRKVGLYTPNMTFNGLRLPKGTTLQQIASNPSMVSKVDVIHESTCQLAWDF